MPIDYFSIYERNDAERRKRAEREVLAKFPNIIRGSSGWYRAMDNRLRRGRG